MTNFTPFPNPFTVSQSLSGDDFVNGGKVKVEVTGTVDGKSLTVMSAPKDIVPTSSEFVQLIRSTCTDSNANEYEPFDNVIGTSEWDGRAGNNVFYFRANNSGADKIQFYFANDTVRDSVLATYSEWRITDSLGNTITVNSVTSAAGSRLSWNTSADFAAGVTYTIEGKV